MGITSIALLLTSGFCLGIGLFYLFLGLRQKELNLTYLIFSLFAFSYSITTLGSMARFNSLTFDQYINNFRWGAPAFSFAYIFLIWFVTLYSKMRVRWFLGIMTAVFLFIALRLPQEVSGIFHATLPWGEQITLSQSNGNTWLLFWIAVPIVSVFILYASIWQYRRGERKEAIVLGLGFIFLAIAIIFDIFVDLGWINFFYISDFGFLPLAIAMSIQLSNKIVLIQNELKHYQLELESVVEERTSQLKMVNEKLAQDVTKREQIEKTLRQSERQLRAVLDAPPDTAMLVTIQGDILAINQIGASRLGITAEEAVGKNVYDLFEAEVAATRKSKKTELLNKKQPMYWEDQRAGRLYRNSIFPVLNDEDEIASIAIFAADVTEQKLLQEKEKESAAIEERSRLARDLHDAVTQTIYSASLIAEVLPQVWARSPDEGQRNLTKLRALVRGALAEMRTMLFELRPAALEAASLETLLGQLGDALHGRTRIPVQVEVEDIPDLPLPVKLAFYRITQEAVNNIIKHAGATQTQIELKRQSGQVCLRVWDNGCGFDPTKTPNGVLGVQIMQERAESIAARFEFDSQSNQGTILTVNWQIPPQNESEA